MYVIALECICFYVSCILRVLVIFDLENSNIFNSNKYEILFT